MAINTESSAHARAHFGNRFAALFVCELGAALALLQLQLAADRKLRHGFDLRLRAVYLVNHHAPSCIPRRQGRNGSTRMAFPLHQFTRGDHLGQPDDPHAHAEFDALRAVLDPVNRRLRGSYLARDGRL